MHGALPQIFPGGMGLIDGPVVRCGFFLNLMNCANAAEYKTLPQLGYMMGRL